MRLREISVLLGVVCIFFACSKDSVPSVPLTPEPTSPAYLQQIIYSKDNGQTVKIDTVSGRFIYAPNNILVYEPYVRFTYDNLQRVSRIDRYTGFNGESGYNYTINYDLNDIPVSGIRIYYVANSNSHSGNGFNLIDSIRYNISDGKIIGVSFYNRVRIGSVFSSAINNFIADTTFYGKDTIDKYTIFYQGANFSKVHSEGPAGKIIDLEYNYGSEKSPFADSRSKHLVAPDMLLSSGYFYIIWHAANELLGYKKTFVTENNRVELSTFSYTYSSTHYPLTANAIDSGIAVTNAVNSGIYQMKFVYK